MILEWTPTDYQTSSVRFLGLFCPALPLTRVLQPLWALNLGWRDGPRFVLQLYHLFQVDLLVQISLRLTSHLGLFIFARAWSLLMHYFFHLGFCSQLPLSWTYLLYLPLRLVSLVFPLLRPVFQAWLHTSSFCLLALMALVFPLLRPALICHFGST